MSDYEDTPEGLPEPEVPKIDDTYGLREEDIKEYMDIAGVSRQKAIRVLAPNLGAQVAQREAKLDIRKQQDEVVDRLDITGLGNKLKGNQGAIEMGLTPRYTDHNDVLDKHAQSVGMSADEYRQELGALNVGYEALVEDIVTRGRPVEHALKMADKRGSLARVDSRTREIEQTGHYLQTKARVLARTDPEAAKELGIEIDPIFVDEESSFGLSGTSEYERRQVVSQPGEYGFQAAQMQAEALVTSNPELGQWVKELSASHVGGDTYITRRATQKLDKWKAANPGYDQKEAEDLEKVFIDQAMEELGIFKTIGWWQMPIFMSSRYRYGDAKDDSFITAMAPQIEIVGLNNKGHVVTRTAGAGQYGIKTVDFLQAGVVGGLATIGTEEDWWSGSKRGIANQRDFLEWSQDLAGHDASTIKKAGYGIAALPFLLLTPDALFGTAGAAKIAGRGGKLVRKGAVTRKHMTSIEDILSGAKGGDIDALTMADIERIQALDKSLMLNDEIAEQMDLLDGQIGAFLGRSNPYTGFTFVKGEPNKGIKLADDLPGNLGGQGINLHPTRRKARAKAQAQELAEREARAKAKGKVEKKGIEIETPKVEIPDLYDYAGHLKRIRTARKAVDDLDVGDFAPRLDADITSESVRITNIISDIADAEVAANFRLKMKGSLDDALKRPGVPARGANTEDAARFWYSDMVEEVRKLPGMEKATDELAAIDRALAAGEITEAEAKAARKPFQAQAAARRQVYNQLESIAKKAQKIADDSPLKRTKQALDRAEEAVKANLESRIAAWYVLHDQLQGGLLFKGRRRVNPLAEGSKLANKIKDFIDLTPDAQNFAGMLQKYFNMSQAEADANARLFDAAAKAWAYQNQRTPHDWWKRTIAGVKSKEDFIERFKNGPPDVTNPPGKGGKVTPDGDGPTPDPTGMVPVVAPHWQGNMNTVAGRASTALPDGYRLEGFGGEALEFPSGIGPKGDRGLMNKLAIRIRNAGVDIDPYRTSKKDLFESINKGLLELSETANGRVVIDELVEEGFFRNIGQRNWKVIGPDGSVVKEVTNSDALDVVAQAVEKLLDDGVMVRHAEDMGGDIRVGPVVYGMSHAAVRAALKDHPREVGVHFIGDQQIFRFGDEFDDKVKYGHDNTAALAKRPDHVAYHNHPDPEGYRNWFSRDDLMFFPFLALREQRVIMADGSVLQLEMLGDAGWNGWNNLSHIGRLFNGDYTTVAEMERGDAVFHAVLRDYSERIDNDVFEAAEAAHRADVNAGKFGPRPEAGPELVEYNKRQNRALFESLSRRYEKLLKEDYGIDARVTVYEGRIPDRRLAPDVEAVSDPRPVAREGELRVKDPIEPLAVKRADDTPQVPVEEEFTSLVKKLGPDGLNALSFKSDDFMRNVITRNQSGTVTSEVVEFIPVDKIGLGRLANLGDWRVTDNAKIEQAKNLLRGFINDYRQKLVDIGAVKKVDNKDRIQYRIDREEDVWDTTWMNYDANVEAAILSDAWLDGPVSILAHTAHDLDRQFAMLSRDIFSPAEVAAIKQELASDPRILDAIELINESTAYKPGRQPRFYREKKEAPTKLSADPQNNEVATFLGTLRASPEPFGEAADNFKQKLLVLKDHASQLGDLLVPYQDKFLGLIADDDNLIQLALVADARRNSGFFKQTSQPGNISDHCRKIATLKWRLRTGDFKGGSIDPAIQEIASDLLPTELDLQRMLADEQAFLRNELDILRGQLQKERHQLVRDLRVLDTIGIINAKNASFDSTIAEAKARLQSPVNSAFEYMELMNMGGPPKTHMYGLRVRDPEKLQEYITSVETKLRDPSLEAEKTAHLLGRRRELKDHLFIQSRWRKMLEEASKRPGSYLEEAVPTLTKTEEFAPPNFPGLDKHFNPRDAERIRNEVAWLQDPENVGMDDGSPVVAGIGLDSGSSVTVMLLDEGYIEIQPTDMLSQLERMERSDAYEYVGVPHLKGFLSPKAETSAPTITEFNMFTADVKHEEISARARDLQGEIARAAHAVRNLASEIRSGITYAGDGKQVYRDYKYGLGRFASLMTDSIRESKHSFVALDNAKNVPISSPALGLGETVLENLARQGVPADTSVHTLVGMLNNRTSLMHNLSPTTREIIERRAFDQDMIRHASAAESHELMVSQVNATPWFHATQSDFNIYDYSLKYSGKHYGNAFGPGLYLAENPELSVVKYMAGAGLGTRTIPDARNQLAAVKVNARNIIDIRGYPEDLANQFDELGMPMEALVLRGGYQPLTQKLLDEATGRTRTRTGATFYRGYMTPTRMSNEGLFNASSEIHLISRAQAKLQSIAEELGLKAADVTDDAQYATLTSDESLMSRLDTDRRTFGAHPSDEAISDIEALAKAGDSEPFPVPGSEPIPGFFYTPAAESWLWREMLMDNAAHIAYDPRFYSRGGAEIIADLSHRDMAYQLDRLRYETSQKFRNRSVSRAPDAWNMLRKMYSGRGKQLRAAESGSDTMRAVQEARQKDLQEWVHQSYETDAGTQRFPELPEYPGDDSVGFTGDPPDTPSEELQLLENFAREVLDAAKEGKLDKYATGERRIFGDIHSEYQPWDVDDHVFGWNILDSIGSIEYNLPTASGQTELPNLRRLARLHKRGRLPPGGLNKFKLNMIQTLEHNGINTLDDLRVYYNMDRTRRADTVFRLKGPDGKQLDKPSSEYLTALVLGGGIAARAPKQADISGLIERCHKFLDARAPTKIDLHTMLMNNNVDGALHFGSMDSNVLILFDPMASKLDNAVEVLVEKGRVFDDDILYHTRRVDDLIEEERAAVEFLDDGRAVIYALGEPDPVSVIHELGHILRRQMSKDDLDGVTAYLNKKLGLEGEDALTHKGNKFVGSKENVRRAEEHFAEAFEAYVARGTAATDIKPAFSRLKVFLGQVVARMTRSNQTIDIDPDVEVFFDKLLKETPDAEPILRRVSGRVQEHMNISGTGSPFPEVSAFEFFSEESRRVGATHIGTKLDADGNVTETIELTRESLEAEYDKLQNLVDSKKLDPEEAVLRIVDEDGNAVPVMHDMYDGGKSTFDLNDVGSLQVRLERERAEALTATMPMAHTKSAAHAVKEFSPIEALQSRLATPGAKAGIGRAALFTFFGGDPNKALRLLPPMQRMEIRAGSRSVEQAIGECVTLVAEANQYEKGGLGKVVKYLTGEILNFEFGGRSVMSSGWNSASSVADAIRVSATEALETDHKALMGALTVFIERTKPHKADERTFTEMFDQFARNDPDAAQLLDKAMHRMFKGKGSFLSDVGNVIQIGKNPTPEEYKLLEALLYFSGSTKRNGKLIDDAGLTWEQRTTKLFDEVNKIYGPKGDIVTKKMALVMAGHGTAGRVFRSWTDMGVAVEEDVVAAFKKMMMGEAISPEIRPRVMDVVRRYGYNPFFLESSMLDAGYHLPLQARKKLSEALARGLEKADPRVEKWEKLGNIPASFQKFLGSEQNMKSVFGAWFRYMKLRMTRGAVMIRPRYFLMNTIDHFTQMGMVTGIRPALISTVRLSAQNALAVPGVNKALAILEKASTLPAGGKYQIKVEQARKILQSGGDAVANALGKMMGASKYNIKLNDILEGKPGTFKVTDKNGLIKVYSYQDIRAIMVQEGIFATFDTTALGKVVRESVENQWRGSTFKDAKTKARYLAEDLLFNSIDDIAEAWSERERAGAVITLIEMGYDPKTASRMTIDALYDYAGTMTSIDRHWLMSLMFPFWAYQKNANRQIFNMMFSPRGAYRMGVIRRFHEGSTYLASELYWSAIVDPYGVYYDGLDDNQKKTYDAVRTRIEFGYGPIDELSDEHRERMERAFNVQDLKDLSAEQINIIENGYGSPSQQSPKVRTAIMRLFAGHGSGAVRVTDGRILDMSDFMSIYSGYDSSGADYYNVTGEELRTPLSGYDPDAWVKMSVKEKERLILNAKLEESKTAFRMATLPRPQEHELPSYYRDRAFISIPPIFDKNTQQYHKLLQDTGHESPWTGVFLPENTIQGGFGHMANMTAFYLLAGEWVLGSNGLHLIDDKDEGSAMLGYAMNNALEEVVNVRNAPIAGEVLDWISDEKMQYPRRISDTTANLIESSGILGMIPVLRTQEVAEWMEEDERRAAFKEGWVAAEEAEMAGARVRPRRNYIPPGMITFLFDNSPLGEFDRMMKAWEMTPQEETMEFQGQLYRWARTLAGADIQEIRGSRTASLEEPYSMRKFRGMPEEPMD